jgi:hypothetical protein
LQQATDGAADAATSASGAVAGAASDASNAVADSTGAAAKPTKAPLFAAGGLVGAGMAVVAML